MARGGKITEKTVTEKKRSERRKEIPRGEYGILEAKESLEIGQLVRCY